MLQERRRGCLKAKGHNQMAPVQLSPFTGVSIGRVTTVNPFTPCPPQPMFGIPLLRSSVLCTVLVLGSLIPAQAVGEARGLFVRSFDKSELSFEIKDEIKLPSFWWPRTLLTYHVVFQSPVKASALCLRNVQTGKAEPFQLSEVREEGGMLKSATVNFFSDLPSGAERRFTLAATGGSPVTPEVRQTREGESLVLDAGKLKVRVPASRKFAAGRRCRGRSFNFNASANGSGIRALSVPSGQ